MSRSAGAISRAILALLFCGSGLVSAEEGLRVEVAGCSEVHADGSCELRPDRRLRVWIRDEPGITVEIEPAPGPPDPIQGGLRFTLVVPEGSDRLIVEPSSGAAADAASLRTFELPLRSPLPADATPDPAWLRRGRTLLLAGHFDSAREVAELWARLGREQDRPLVEAEALLLLADVHEDRGNGHGEDRALRSALDAYARAGLLSSRSKRLSRLYFRRIDRRDFAAARELDTAWRSFGWDAEERFRSHFYPAFLLTQTGQLRAALQRARQAAEVAERLDIGRYRVPAETRMAQILDRLGHHLEARRRMACNRLRLAGSFSTCSQAQALNSYAWSLLMEREESGSTFHAEPIDGHCQGHRPAVDPRAHGDFELMLAAESEGDEALRELLEAAHERAAEGCGEGSIEPANIGMNQVILELLSGRPSEARKALEALHSASPPSTGDMVLWDWEIRGRLALAADDGPAAQTAFASLGNFARKALWPEGEWRAAFGLAETAEKMGDRQSALGHLERSEQLLEQRLRFVPMYSERERWVRQRSRASRLHIRLLLESNDAAAALGVARRARARAWRTLRPGAGFGPLDQQRKEALRGIMEDYHRHRADLEASLSVAWTLPIPELERIRRESDLERHRLRESLDLDFAALAEVESPEPMPLRAGELLLLVQPLESGWVLFAADREGVEAHSLDRLDDLLDTWREPVDSARREALAAYLLTPVADSLRHAERLRWQAVGAAGSIDFHALPFDGAPLGTLVPTVFGLDSRLPSSPPAERGPGRTLLVADPGGDLPRARSEGERIEELLIEGEGRAPFRLGPDPGASELATELRSSDHFHYAGHAHFAGWNSHLPLGRGSRFGLEDILALPSAPTRVVLSGCETGRGLDRHGGRTLGLAHAFVLAGSKAVVAATRKVDDEASRRLMVALYEASNRGAPLDEALRQAQAAEHERAPSSDWAAFRLYEP